MPVYVIVQGKIENRAMLDQYMAKAGPTIAPYQGKLLAYNEEPEVIEGPRTRALEHPRTVLIEFPSMKEAHAWYDSPEYQKILPLRLMGAPGTLIVVNGAD
jgi:uncharacterized protein (DUF1330 family)